MASDYILFMSYLRHVIYKGIFFERGFSVMTKQEIKQAVLAAIDAGREEIYAVKDSIYQNPEFGYKEVKTTATVADFLESLGLKVERNIAVTGCRARANEGKSGPHIAVMGELDGISCKEHKDANEIGASHTCGHNLQVAGMIGAALGLVRSGVLDQLTTCSTPRSTFHKVFGRGTVTRVTPAAGDMIVEIHFDKVGVKKMMANLAPLTRETEG